MRTLAKPIKMIAWFDDDGTIRPVRFKLSQEDEESMVIKINNITNRQLEKLAGNLMWKFTCISVINGIEKSYDVKFDVINGKWFLFL